MAVSPKPAHTAAVTSMFFRSYPVSSFWKSRCPPAARPWSARCRGSRRTRPPCRYSLTSWESSVIVQRQAVGVQRVGFVVVGLFPGVEQICVLLTVILQGHAVAIGEVAVVVFEPQQRLGFVELAVQKSPLAAMSELWAAKSAPRRGSRGVGADWR